MCAFRVQSLCSLVGGVSLGIIGGDGLPGFTCKSCEARQRTFDFLDPTLAATDKRYCHVALAYREDLEMLQSEGRHCNKTIAFVAATTQVGLPVSPLLKRPLLAAFAHVTNKAGLLKPMVKAREELGFKCPEQPTAKDFAFDLNDLSGIWFVTGGFSVLALAVTLITWAFSYKKSRRQSNFKSDARVHRFDQNGEQLNKLERGDEWILLESNRIYLEPSFRGTYIAQVRPTFNGRDSETVDRTMITDETSLRVDERGILPAAKSKVEMDSSTGQLVTDDSIFLLQTENGLIPKQNEPTKSASHWLTIPTLSLNTGNVPKARKQRRRRRKKTRQRTSRK